METPDNLKHLLEPLAITAPTATDQVFHALQQAILSMQLPPGARISEAEIARQMGVSRQPVRDAFFRLSSLGFLIVRPQRATLVAPISRKAVENAVFTRTALEVECLRAAAARLDDRGRAALRANLDAQRDAHDNGDRARFHALDEAFHELLCKLSGQAHVWPMIQGQKGHMDRVRYLTLSDDRRPAVLAEHGAIVSALLGGDADRAEGVLRDHIGTIHARLAEAYQQYPTLFGDVT
ncbi:DNA-binding GntR family transcriptional regulator [Albidovulum inexpectatum]|uniref:DNA-binding GntR family transcriptional regulator n=1 Tax=Albidovulum inexpectatum TaxID=196587 RepID=A0A2S5JHI4_9RHOB|nr:GntR family transcriptional regulator [Albidovulum inexpectatum]PPB80828.1 DNA-binding GntR family transcriptional regulator [Albidovulum inexpectatum]